MELVNGADIFALQEDFVISHNFTSLDFESTDLLTNYLNLQEFNDSVENSSSLNCESEILNISAHNETDIPNSVMDVSSVTSSEKRRNHKDSLKNEILSLKNFEYRHNQELHYKEEVDFISVINNCVVSEINSELLNCNLLNYYYRIGEFLYKVLNELQGYLSNIHENNIITGLIKGTGIASSFRNHYKNYGTSESRRARTLFNKSIRVYKVYKHFPNPIIQMYRAEKITANKLLKIGGSVWVNEDFEEFAEEIKAEITRNYDKYNLGVDYSIVFGNDLHISNEILENVKKFSNNPSLDLV
jgi:hypothetical protein